MFSFTRVVNFDLCLSYRRLEFLIAEYVPLTWGLMPQTAGLYQILSQGGKSIY